VRVIYKWWWHIRKACIRQHDTGRLMLKAMLDLRRWTIDIYLRGWMRERVESGVEVLGDERCSWRTILVSRNDVEQALASCIKRPPPHGQQGLNVDAGGMVGRLWEDEPQRLIRKRIRAVQA
jgi:hypothetical protein